ASVELGWYPETERGLPCRIYPRIKPGNFHRLLRTRSKRSWAGISQTTKRSAYGPRVRTRLQPGKPGKRLGGDLTSILTVWRARIRGKWTLAAGEVRSCCPYRAQFGEEVSPQALPQVISDPKGQAIIETAATGKAGVICTSDAHFFDSKVLSFCAAHAISVMK